MRRVFASLLLALSLLVASGSWAGFILTRTALDPGRSEAVADNLLDNTVVRGVIVDRLSDAVEAQIPPSVPITRATIEVAADEALDDPRVETVIRDGFVRAHQNALNGVDEPVQLDASALGQVGREKAVEIAPELETVLPPAPELAVDLPTGGLSFLGTLRNSILRYTLLGAVVAAVGVVSALIITPRRPKALRRVSYWAFANSAFWLLVAFGLPELVGRLAPSSMSIASAVVDVFVGAMIRPALYMAGAGVALLALSFVWPAMARRRPAAMVDGSRTAPGALHQPRPVLEGLTPPSRAGATHAAAAYPNPAPDPGYRHPAPAHPNPGYPNPAPDPGYRPGPAQIDPVPDPGWYPGAGVPATPDPTMVFPAGVVQSEPYRPDPTPYPTPGSGLHDAPTTLSSEATTSAWGAQQPEPTPIPHEPGPAPVGEAPPSAATRPADDHGTWSLLDPDAPTEVWSADEEGHDRGRADVYPPDRRRY